MSCSSVVGSLYLFPTGSVLRIISSHHGRLSLSIYDAMDVRQSTPRPEVEIRSLASLSCVSKLHSRRRTLTSSLDMLDGQRVTLTPVRLFFEDDIFLVFHCLTVLFIAPEYELSECIGLRSP